jgi:hypothetical protein
MLGKMSWQQFLLNGCKISSEYCRSKKKGKIMEELSSLIMLHKNTTNSRM